VKGAPSYSRCMLETQMWVNGGGVVRVGNRNACMSQLLTPSISFIGQVWRRGDTESIVWIGLEEGSYGAL
jgi:hypothetical protein